MADMPNKNVGFIKAWMTLLVKEGVIDEAEAAKAVEWVAAHSENWVCLRVAMGKDNKRVEAGFTGCNANGLYYGSGDIRKARK